MRGITKTWIRGPALAALLLLTILPPAAVAQDPAVDQYVESVPGAEGDRPAREDQPSGGVGIPPEVRQEIQAEGGQDAPALREVASSRELGASEAPSRDETAAPREPADTNAVEAGIAAAAPGEGRATPWLLAGLAIATAAVALVVVRSRAPAK